MGHLQLLPHHDPTCADLVGVNFETAALVAEHVRVLRQDPRQQPYYRPGQKAPVRRRIAAVEKAVFLLGVAMEITVNVELFRFVLHVVLFCEEDLRVQVFVRIQPLTVQVVARERTAVVTADHTVWVQARRQQECIVLPQLGCLLSQ